ncbi:hypothetical protein [Pseudomonas sp. NA-150]
MEKVFFQGYAITAADSFAGAARTRQKIICEDFQKYFAMAVTR